VTVLFQVLMLLVAIFLVLLVLVQRGRGGGLTGALGGMGGQSAFGTKAGDLFTRITIGAALVWIVLACVAVKWFSSRTQFDQTLGAQAPLVSPAGRVAPPAETPGSEEEPGTGGAEVPVEKPGDKSGK